MLAILDPLVADDFSQAPPVDLFALRPWHVAQVKPQQERSFANRLESAGVRAYLPLTTRRIRRRERADGREWTEKLRSPLFPGYVFFCGDSDAIGEAYATRKLISLLPVFSQRALVRELRAVAAALETCPSLGVVQTIAQGDRVQIIHGPFRGFTGRYLDDKTDACFVLLETMGREMQIELSRDFVERIE